MQLLCQYHNIIFARGHGILRGGICCCGPGIHRSASRRNQLETRWCARSTTEYGSGAAIIRRGKYIPDYALRYAGEGDARHLALLGVKHMPAAALH